MGKDILSDIVKGLVGEILDTVQGEKGEVSYKDENKIMKTLRKEAKKRLGVKMPKVKKKKKEEGTLLDSLTSSDFVKNMTGDLTDVSDGDKLDLKNIILKKIIKGF